MIAIIVLAIVAGSAFGQHYQRTHFDKLNSWQTLDLNLNHGNNYNNLNALNSHSRCPSLERANNNDFENLEGLWFRIEEAWSGHRTVCSSNTYQLTGHNTLDVYLRNNETRSRSDLYSHNRRDRDDLRVGSIKRLEDSVLLENLDDGEQYLLTVLDSDYNYNKRGYALVHLCNTRDLNDQIVRILSRDRYLDQNTLNRLRAVLIRNGLGKLESQLRRVQHDDCNQDKRY